MALIFPSIPCTIQPGCEKYHSLITYASYEIIKYLVIFFCYGPLLFIGLAQFVGVLAEDLSRVILLGSGFGFFALNYFLYHDFKCLFENSKENNSSNIISINFDQYIFLLKINSILVILVYLATLFLLMDSLNYYNSLLQLFIFCFVFYYSFRSYSELKKIRSPMSSKTGGLFFGSLMHYVFYSMSIISILYQS